jgi:hypothetical protein
MGESSWRNRAARDVPAMEVWNCDVGRRLPNETATFDIKKSVVAAVVPISPGPTHLRGASIRQCLGYTGHHTNAAATAAHPNETIGQISVRRCEAVERMLQGHLNYFTVSVITPACGGSSTR